MHCLVQFSVSSVWESGVLCEGCQWVGVGGDKLLDTLVDGRGVCPRWRSFSFCLGSSAVMHPPHMPACTHTHTALSRLLASTMLPFLCISVLDVTNSLDPPPPPLFPISLSWPPALVQQRMFFSFFRSKFTLIPVPLSRLFGFLFFVGTSPHTLDGAIQCHF